MAAVVALVSAPAASGGVKPFCTSTGDISSFCVTWVEAGFDSTTLQVTNNGTGVIAALDFRVEAGSALVGAGSSGGGNNCRVTGSTAIACKELGLQTGYGTSITLFTSSHDHPFGPGTVGELTLYDAGDEAQGATSVTLQSISGSTTPGTGQWQQRLRTADAEEMEAHKAANKAWYEAHQAELNRKLANWHGRMQEEARAARAKAEAAVDALPPGSDVPAADLTKLTHLRDDLLAGEGKLEMTVQDTNLAPSQYAPELSEAENDIQAAEIITEQVM